MSLVFAFTRARLFWLPVGCRQIFQRHADQILQPLDAQVTIDTFRHLAKQWLDLLHQSGLAADFIEIQIFALVFKQVINNRDLVVEFGIETFFTYAADQTVRVFTVGQEKKVGIATITQTG